MPKKSTQTADASDASVQADKLKSLLKNYNHPKPIQTVRSGIHPIDLLLGNGFPRGRIIEFFGPEMGGKSLLFWHLAIAWQKMGGIVVFFDFEATAPADFMTKLGVNNDDLIYEEVQTIEQMDERISTIVSELRAVTNAPILIGCDSVAAASSDAEWDIDDGIYTPKDSGQPARQAAAMSRFCKMNTHKFAKEDVTFVAINQIREKIGVMFGKNTESPCGRALKHYASIRIEITRGKKFEVNDMVKGTMVHISAVKNKCSEPLRKTQVRVDWGSGFNPWIGLEEVLVEAGRIKAKGAGKFEYKDETFTKAEIQEFVQKHEELLAAW